MIKFLKKRWYLLLVVIIIGFFVYRNQTSIKGKIETYKIKKEDLKETLSLSGKIEADEKVNLKFQTSGRLTWVGVKEGDVVKKYQMVATLDRREIQNRLQKYLNTYAIGRNTFEQTKADNVDNQNDLSKSIREKAYRVLENNQYNLNNTVLDVEYQNLSLDYANLWTPIDGIVTHVSSPFPGVNITPTGAEFDIVNPETLYFSVTAEQSDVIKLKEGMTGDIILDSYPDQNYKGTLYYISFAPKDGETGTVYELRLKLDDQIKQLPLKLGMTGDLDFILREIVDVISVPSRFIKKDSKGSYVQIIKNNNKEKRYIELGAEIDGKIEIKSGVTSGETIYD
ncbi:MAG: efflux RND transporter periplasmic adaptor subunit [Patescibacteria group bacterium]|jgi:RND family efflux transporter MFP subunit